jgi:hypothetical protein
MSADWVGWALSFWRFHVVDCAESANFDKIRQIPLLRFLKNLTEMPMMGGSAGFLPSGAGNVFQIRLVVVPFGLWHQLANDGAACRESSREPASFFSDLTAVDGRGKGL